MRDFTGKRYWLVGASEGLGRALAEGLSRRGAHLVLSARNRDRLEELAAALPGSAEALPMDISDSASVRAAAAEMGPVDGVIFLAGVYWPMKATEWDADKAEAMADINFTGAVRVLGQVVPDMVARGGGHLEAAPRHRAVRRRGARRGPQHLKDRAGAAPGLLPA